MRFVVLGAGAMGRAVALDLSRAEAAEEVLVADADAVVAEEVATSLASSRVGWVRLDVTNGPAVVDTLRGRDMAVSCVPYRFNLGLARAAVEAGCSFSDLGGNTPMVMEELALDAAAREAGVTIVPDCGLAPGMTNVLAADAVGRFDSVDELHIRVGGLPVDPQPPLDYMLLFNPAGLINEYREDCIVLRDGRVATVPPLEDLEELEFPEPFGLLEAFNTSGGTSTLPHTYAGRVRELDYKTIRYPGHCERFRRLRDVGFFDETPVMVGGQEVVPRQLLEESLLETLPREGDDVTLVRVTTTGDVDGLRRTLTHTVIDHCDGASGLTAMQRCTAFPATIVARMVASGEIGRRGAVPQELVVPPARFIEELGRRGIEVDVSWD